MSEIKALLLSHSPWQLCGTTWAHGSASFVANNFLLSAVFISIFSIYKYYLYLYLSSILLPLQTFLISCLAAVARLTSATTNSAAAKLKMKFVARIDFQTYMRTKERARRQWQKFENEAIYLYIWYNPPSSDSCQRSGNANRNGKVENGAALASWRAY